MGGPQRKGEDERERPRQTLTKVWAKAKGEKARRAKRPESVTSANTTLTSVLLTRNVWPRKEETQKKKTKLQSASAVQGAMVEAWGIH